MSIDPRFRQVRQFDDATRAVRDLEDNAGDALQRIADQALPKLTPTNIKIAAYVAGLDELVMTNGTLAVTLPVATAANNGRVVGVVVQSGTVTVTSQSAVQGATSDALATAGLYLYVSTGSTWWRPAIGAGGASVSPATTIVTETAFGQGSAVGTGVKYARDDHTHGSPATPVTSIAASDGTLVFSAPTGAVTARVGVISDANVDETIVTESVFASQVKKLRLELQHVRLLISTLVDLELSNG